MYDQTDVAMIDIDSGDVIQMRDETFDELLNEINDKSSQIRMSAVFCWTAVVIGVLSGLTTGGVGFVLLLLALPALLAGQWLDSYRRSVVLYYDLEGDAEDSYKQLAKGFDGLLGCAGKWHIEAGGAVTNLTVWKRNAGASHLVKKNATTLSYRLPTVIKSNVIPPSFAVGRQTLFFMPDIILVQDGTRFGVVPYGELALRWQDTRFIEEGRVPSDSLVVGHTWKHPNKSGGPDRRFRDNRQIPICLYETIHFQSKSGLNELVEFSQRGKAAAFAEGCDLLSRLPREKTTRSLPAPSSATPNTSTEQNEPRKRRSLRNFFLIALTLVVGLPGLGMLLPNPPPKQAAATVDRKLDLATQSIPPNADKSAPSTPEQSPSSADTQHQHSSSPPAEDSALPAMLAPPASSSRQPSAVNPDTLDQSPAGGAKPEANQTKHTLKAVNLRAGPSTKNRILVTVPEGTAVKVLRLNGGWSYVDTGDGTIGWIASELLATD